MRFVLLLSMYKNQLQELAQRSCFNLPSYSCIREGPDHAPRFKATVNFSGETFESPTFCSTLRQAEHAAAEVALTTLASRGPSRALAAKVLDETGVYKNLLQETAHRAGLNLPAYSTIRSGPGHVPSFSCTVELAGKSFTGQPARTKKQAQKNAAMAAWSALRKLSQESMSSCSSSALVDSKTREEQDQVIIARFLSSLQPPESEPKEVQKRQIRSVKPNVRSLYSRSLCPLQYQNRAYSSVPHEMVMYRMWEREKLLQQQLHLVRLPIPSTISSPQVLPGMQSVISPDSCQYIPARQFCSPVLGPRIAIATSVPFSCFPNQVIPDPMSSRPRVTIQEIQEEQVEESSGFPTTVTSDSRVLRSSGSELRISGQDPWNVEENSRLQTLHTCDSSPLHHRPQYSPSASLVRCFSQPSAVESAMNRSSGSVPVVQYRPQNLAPHVHAPPRMRTGAHSYSARPKPEGRNVEALRPCFLAPPVRIRSVVPVCSAPPSGRTPISRPDDGLNVSRNRTAAPEEVVTSELGKLQL
ncbi:hypothetical protein BT93_H2966 [Corymbia citriodora subsp. variegata]|nr:hypothetical protein BT93_H2966 [Corymbia citriodora subsp. variegata]